MAFQAPQRQQARPSSSWAQQPPAPVETTSSQLPAREQIPDDTEWILFSPDTAIHPKEDTASSKTAGRSRLSDFGSLETAAAAEKFRQEGQPHDEAEGEDLDSLDDGLHAFSEPYTPLTPRRTIEQSGDTVLPAHDGLGMFPGNSSPVQEQFWQHERYNPRRRRHSLRRSSLQKKIEAQEEEEGSSKQNERFRRIEEWRVEQSRAILEEIERETRRRRRRSRLSASKLDKAKPESPIALPTAPESEKRTVSSQTLSFWERVTRSIRSLIGIDDATLSFIFGEALPVESPAGLSAAEIVDYAEKHGLDDQQLVKTGDAWEDRLLARIAKELGHLMHHITAHPGAFSTYLMTQEPVPYAGIHASESQNDRAATIHPPSLPHFKPTLPQSYHRRRQSAAATTDPSLWGIEEEEDEDTPPSPAQAVPTATQAAERLKQERDYWEKDLDVKMVFGYLRQRMSSSSPNNSTPSNLHAAAPARSSNNASSLRRAALIRHHHPLVSAAPQTSSAPPAHNLPVSPAKSVQSPPTPLSPVLGRRHNYEDEGAISSCASQSASKRSKTGHSNGKGSRGGSSLNRNRNYWDWDWGIGGGHGSLGSVASGPAWSAGWGEA